MATPRKPKVNLRAKAKVVKPKNKAATQMTSAQRMTRALKRAEARHKADGGKGSVRKYVNQAIAEEKKRSGK